MKYIYLFILIFSFNSYSDFVPNSFSSKIKQKVLSALGGERISEGELKYQKKGKVFLEITSPLKDKYTFVSNGSKIWYYIPPLNDKGKGELTTQNNQNSPLALFFDALDFGLKNNDYYTVKDFKEGVHILFKEKMKTKLNLKSGDIYFKEENGKRSKNFDSLEKIELVYNDNRKVTLFLSDINSMVKFSPSDFSFVPPANTNIK